MSIKYTTKEDCIKKGISKKNGKFYKKSLLEVWYDRGWLELENSLYGAETRLLYGLKFMLDYHIVARQKLRSQPGSSDRVDSSIPPESEPYLDALDRYQKAIRNIPAEFWPLVRKICLEEIEPQPSPELSERQRSYFFYICRYDLCRGLDRVVTVYTKRLSNRTNGN